MRSLFKKLKHDKSGNFGIMTALLMVPLLGSAGMIVDCSRAMQIRWDMQNAADMAALGAISEKSAGVLAAMNMPADGTVTLSEQDALNLFNGQINTGLEGAPVAVQISVTKKGADLKASVKYAVSIETSFLRIIGKDSIAISGKAEAAFQTANFQDFFVLLDNTPSMGVGATPADVTLLEAKTGCAFACHIAIDGQEVPVEITDNKVKKGTSSYSYAGTIGVTLRIDVVAQATAALMVKVGESRRYDNQFRVGLYTFGQRAEDLKLLEVQNPTSNLIEAEASAKTIKLMSIPRQNYDNDQQTSFDKALTEIETYIGTPGNGLSSATPEKVVMLVADGVGDSYKPSGCTKPTKGDRCQEPIDTKYCKALKDKNIRVAVLYTTYVPTPSDPWYEKWIKPFQNEIGTKMEECASPGLYFEVSPTEGISKAMNALFLKASRSPRLTS
ncbi:TadE/TadG family type IV pilus assembly protein [Pararhizobium sp.]|uniref:TadE/TadG family type IV pilus assembly protein n=1 Tax=Pararhizobium sp. TaxID=1977563 RepID=UPI002726FFFF|nr:TadE/TadG family type IV pilus assembly protein [Pararhizobium sp.]MDO9418949.1 pilus assembly protein TadG-related protein [Pararhizobium sp.]